MTNATITLEPKHVLAALLFAANKDVRYYLNGILIEATDTGTRVTATDGHTLATMRATAVNGMGGEEKRSFIIPRAAIEQIKGAIAKTPQTLRVHIDEGAHTLLVDEMRIPFQPIDGRFPDYRAIVPPTASGKPAQFNPELLARFGKAAKLLKKRGGGHSTYLRHNGEQGTLVTLVDVECFAGVIMPMRDKGDDGANNGSWMDTAWAREA
jgi:DNA polymerase-3 subunit beta